PGRSVLALFEFLEAELVVFLGLSKLLLHLQQLEAHFLDAAVELPDLLFHLLNADRGVIALREHERRLRGLTVPVEKFRQRKRPRRAACHHEPQHCCQDKFHHVFRPALFRAELTQLETLSNHAKKQPSEALKMNGSSAKLWKSKRRPPGPPSRIRLPEVQLSCPRGGSATSRKCRRRRRPAFPCRKKSSASGLQERRAQRDIPWRPWRGAHRAPGCIRGYRVRRRGLRW